MSGSVRRENWPSRMRKGRPPKVDTGLETATAAEGIAAAREGDGEGRFSGHGHRPIVLSGPTSGQANVYEREESPGSSDSLGAPGGR
jgi:hypothetical protein